MQKILIILEEDLFLGNVINEKIRNEGYQTLLFGNASVALEQMEAFNPDLIILDMDLRTANALKILGEKTKKNKISAIPTIIISPYGDVDEIKKVLDLGVKDYIVKSQFSADELISKIKNILGNGSKSSTADVSLEGKKVMWVEDDQFLSDLIARKLGQKKCKLLFTRTGEEALQILEQDKPDIILLDLLLPGISGFEVLAAIKKNDRLKNIPIIILSNFTQNNEIEKTRTMGADRFLTKATVILDDIVKEMQEVLVEKRG